MTRSVLNKVAKDLGINLSDYDMVEGVYTNSRETFIEVSVWKDQGKGSTRSKHDVRTKRYSVAALSKAWQNGGADWSDYLTGGPRRIFNIK